MLVKCGNEAEEENSEAPLEPQGGSSVRMSALWTQILKKHSTTSPNSNAGWACYRGKIELILLIGRVHEFIRKPQASFMPRKRCDGELTALSRMETRMIC